MSDRLAKDQSNYRQEQPTMRGDSDPVSTYEMRHSAFKT